MKKTICLNMIVKNEKDVIERCLASVKPLIDTWVIVDTGSNDGTQEIIKKILQDIPGQLHERQWVDFAHNRNEALELAKDQGDYLLFIDADDRLVFSNDFVLPELTADLYSIPQREAYQNTYREHLVFFLMKNQGEFEWAGKIHEYLKTKNSRPKDFGQIPNVLNEYINDGSRSKDKNKSLKDILILKKAIEENPDSPREIFYLARTYYSIEDFEAALKYFEIRSKMGDDPIEVYECLLYIAICQRRLNFDPAVFIRSFCQAHLFRPTRAEALYEAARYFTEQQNFFLGYVLSKIAIGIPITTDNLFVESWVYDWGASIYFFLSAHQIGQTGEAKAVLEKLLSNPRLPWNLRQHFQLDQYAAVYRANCKTHYP